MKKYLFAALALGLVVSLVPTAEASGNNARVRVIHASPDAPEVDVLADGGPLFLGARFTGITPYQNVPANVYNVQVVAAGTAGPAVIDADLNLFYGTSYTVVATNFLADISPLVLEDSNRFVAFGSASLRFIHASPDAPNVDIKVVDGPYLFQNVAFQGIGDYVTVPYGRYDLEVRVAGTETVALTVEGANFRRSSTNTVVAVGTLAGGDLQVIGSEDRRGFGFFGYETVDEDSLDPIGTSGSIVGPRVNKNDLMMTR